MNIRVIIYLSLAIIAISLFAMFTIKGCNCKCKRTIFCECTCKCGCTCGCEIVCPCDCNATKCMCKGNCECRCQGDCGNFCTCHVHEHKKVSYGYDLTHDGIIVLKKTNNNLFIHNHKSLLANHTHTCHHKTVESFIQPNYTTEKFGDLLPESVAEVIDLTKDNIIGRLPGVDR